MHSDGFFISIKNVCKKFLHDLVPEEITSALNNSFFIMSSLSLVLSCGVSAVPSSALLRDAGDDGTGGGGGGGSFGKSD